MTDRAVLLSIKPKYCELIASGEKTVEVRKTRPKIPTPFKAYIYCTKDFYRKGDGYFQGKCCGKVIGEFVCDGVASLKCDNGYHAAFNRHHNTCLADEEIMKYANNGTVHYLNITNIKIYDTPKELSEFCFPPERYCEKGLCGRCPYDQVPNEYGEYEFDCEWKRPIIRPPQSWCYVQEVSNND